MKSIVLTLLAISLNLNIYSQTTATNFNVSDCDGEMYNLFDDLDQGNVVVLAWVMPCVSCIQHPLETFQIVQDYDPQKVKFLMIDDYADHSCSVIQTWSANYQMGSCTKFVNNTISMDDYGTHGMPKIVVTGCKSHKIFYNQNSSSTGIKAAIDQAILECSNTSISELIDFSSNLTIFPNPTAENVHFSIDNPSSRLNLSITNLIGIEVLSVNQYTSEKPIDVSFLTDGVYLTKIISGNKIYTKPFVVNR